MTKSDLIQQIKNVTYEEALKLLNNHDKEIKEKAYQKGYDKGYKKGYDAYDPDGWIM